MNIILVRNIYTLTSTIGDLLIDHHIFCHTLEDIVRQKSAKKIYGKTAIRSGLYRVVLSMSTRFKRITPEILDVPDFIGVRMHGGNTADDTDGCVLVAKNIISKEKVYGTMERQLTDLMRNCNEPHWIEIVDTYPYVGVI